MAVVAGKIDILLITETKTDSTLKVNFILMALTYPTDITETLTVVAFWFMLAMTLDQV